MPVIDTQELTKLYYSIGEVAEKLDVNTSLLRFWEKEFQFEVSKKNKKGNRLFSLKEIEKINKIYQLVKVEGYTLEGAKKALKNKVLVTETTEKQTTSTSNDEIILKLNDIKNRLLALKVNIRISNN